MDRGITITWIGHATTLIETASGTTILIDPFIQDNPVVPPDKKHVSRVDLMLITHGHQDHLADAIPIAQRTRPEIVAIVEVAGYLQSKGAGKVTGMNKGGTVHRDGVDITMVDAIHSSGITDGDAILPGGTAAGYVLRFADGFTVYFAGDTDVFESMKAIGRVYKPDLAMLPIGDHYTMGPRQAAEAIRMLGVRNIIPIHYGTFPVLTGTPEELEREASDISSLRIIALKPGESISQSELT
jgi:L-ascorbate metabolism protein UlaG (beta-lactamase superfamily)